MVENFIEPQNYPPKEAMHRSIIRLCHNYYTKQFSDDDLIISIGFLKIMLELIKKLSDKELLDLLMRVRQQYYMDPQCTKVAHDLIAEIIMKVKNEDNPTSGHE